ncbi:LysR family transcriptional regulator [Aquincola tertiaricarbonis]|uniref:LysR family transcriptional regulator n=1 Tax=Aquincola tertiaricarbonis TaxID=391953 RepID=A0ABY4SF75_AQUTE|nr:LysR family transcriptional regulator [Aquincola tertiaricarbonis]URI11124.1 LysR family transcriptional regulator [Aquincola tertiaricarbonis]
MRPGFNYKHLHYFWVVAKEGGMASAAERLDVAVQTVSAQVRELEQALGHALLKPAGRGLALTEAGEAALRQADQIFQLGEQLPDVVRDAATQPALRLAVGISDGLPKMVVHRLIMPVLAEPGLRLLCHEGGFDELLAELALHKLDLVLSDRPAPVNANLKLYSHALGGSELGWYAPSALAAAARKGFPQSLAQVPVLLPTAHATVRVQIDTWFARHGVRPNVVGEFEDSALLKTFGAGGMGVFPAALLVHDDLLEHYRVKPVGGCDGVREQFYAIGTERRVQHPLIRRLVEAAEG